MNKHFIITVREDAKSEEEKADRLATARIAEEKATNAANAASSASDAAASVEAVSPMIDALQTSVMQCTTDVDACIVGVNQIKNSLFTGGVEVSKAAKHLAYSYKSLPTAQSDTSVLETTRALLLEPLTVDNILVNMDKALIAVRKVSTAIKVKEKILLYVVANLTVTSDSLDLANLATSDLATSGLQSSLSTLSTGISASFTAATSALEAANSAFDKDATYPNNELAMVAQQILGTLTKINGKVFTSFTDTASSLILNNKSSVSSSLSASQSLVEGIGTALTELETLKTTLTSFKTELLLLPQVEITPEISTRYTDLGNLVLSIKEKLDTLNGSIATASTALESPKTQINESEIKVLEEKKTVNAIYLEVVEVLDIIVQALELVKTFAAGATSAIKAATTKRDILHEAEIKEKAEADKAATSSQDDVPYIEHTLPFKVREDWELETFFNRTFSRNSSNLKHTLPLGRPLGWQTGSESAEGTIRFPSVPWHRVLELVVGRKIHISNLRNDKPVEEFWAVATDESYQDQDTLYLTCVQLVRGE